MVNVHARRSEVSLWQACVDCELAGEIPAHAQDLEDIPLYPSPNSETTRSLNHLVLFVCYLFMFSAELLRVPFVSCGFENLYLQYYLLPCFIIVDKLL